MTQSIIQPITKDALARKYGISPATLRRLMNERYLKSLQSVGYSINMVILPPNVVRKFIEIYGDPINDEI